MANVPLEASDIKRFTPRSLANLPSPPVFLLRAGNRRDRQRYQAILLEEGLKQHSLDRQRAETLVGLQNLWSAEDYEANEGRLKAYWDAIDQWGRTNKGNPTPEPFVHPDTGPVTELITRITDAWPPLRKLSADNLVFQAEAPNVLVSIVLVGWTGINLPYRRESGIAPLDLLEQLENELMELENAHDTVEGLGRPGTAFLELCAEAGGRLFLTKEQEKNSQSPPQSSPTRSTSKTGGKGKGPGRSTASATSPQTPVT